MNFTEDDFPPLGAPPPKKKEAVLKKDLDGKHRLDSFTSQTTNQLASSPEPMIHKPTECFLCGQTRGFDLIDWGEWVPCGFLHGQGACRDCLKKTPRSFILEGYMKEGETFRGSARHIDALCDWITLRSDIWPNQYPEEIKLADGRNERWESLHYYTVWKKEKRFIGEDIAWFSTRQQEMVIGKINQLMDDGTCLVYRDAQTEKEKKLGECFRKTLNKTRLMPPLSQRASLELIRKTPGFTRPRSQAPFKCDGPCGRVRISDQSNLCMSGPLKSNQNGCSYCKDCYKEYKIEERDNNLWRAREYFSDREHRGFGGCMGHNGKIVSCSCPSCDNHHRNYICEECGCKGGDGWFDRRSYRLTGIPIKCAEAAGEWSISGGWNEDDRWKCKKCWVDRYWRPGSWEWLGEGNVKFFEI